MPKKTQYTKKDIIRWITVFPLTIFIIFLFSSFVLEPIYRFLPKLINENLVAYISSRISAVLLPALVILCGYIISPKFKFRSTVILVLVFFILQSINLLFNEYSSNNRVFLIITISYLVGLYILYRVVNLKT